VPVGKLLKFSRQELLAVYAIVLAGAPLVSHGVLGYMLPHEIFLQHGVHIHPEWKGAFFSYIPNWFSPTDPKAVEEFFTGNALVPWKLWWTPLAMWSSFLTALAMASVCLTLLLQRHWISNERLSFPLAQIPLELVREKKTSTGRDCRSPESFGSD